MQTTWVRISKITTTGAVTGVLTGVLMGLGALVAGAPAWADTGATLRAGQAPTTAVAFATHGCDAAYGGGPYAGQDVWSFVLPDRSRRFVSLTGSLDTDGDGFADLAPAATVVAGGGDEDGGTSKAWFTAPAGATLLGANAVVSGSAATKGVTFNIRSTCPPPAPSPSPVPSSAPSGATPSLSSAAIVFPASATPNRQSGSGGGLPAGTPLDASPTGVPAGDESSLTPAEVAVDTGESPQRTVAAARTGGAAGMGRFVIAAGAVSAFLGLGLLLMLRRRTRRGSVAGRHRLLEYEPDDLGPEPQ